MPCPPGRDGLRREVPGARRRGEQRGRGRGCPSGAASPGRAPPWLTSPQLRRGGTRSAARERASWPSPVPEFWERGRMWLKSTAGHPLGKRLEAETVNATVRYVQSPQGSLRETRSCWGRNVSGRGAGAQEGWSEWRYFWGQASVPAHSWHGRASLAFSWRSSLSVTSPPLCDRSSAQAQRCVNAQRGFPIITFSKAVLLPEWCLGKASGWLAEYLRCVRGLTSSVVPNLRCAVRG